MTYVMIDLLRQIPSYLGNQNATDYSVYLQFAYSCLAGFVYGCSLMNAFNDRLVHYILDSWVGASLKTSGVYDDLSSPAGYALFV